MGILLTLQQFIPQIPHWHSLYLCHNSAVPTLEQKIQEQAKKYGFLDKQALKEIAIWRGNAYSRWQQMWKKNTDDWVHYCTVQAIAVLHQPEMALNEIKRIRQWGTSFGSKTLAFLSPSTCPILDLVVQDCLSGSFDWTRRYRDLVALCQNIANQIPEVNPYRPSGAWLVRDVEMAIFQFGWPETKEGPGGQIIGPLLLSK